MRLFCKNHPDFNAKRGDNSWCMGCWTLYELTQLAAEGVIREQVQYPEGVVKPKLRVGRRR